MSNTTIVREASCLFCHEVCQVPNEDIGYEGCECTIPYHTKCIKEWFTKQGQSCPLCRKVVRVYTCGPDDQFKNECAMYLMLTVAVNFVLSCIV